MYKFNVGDKVINIKEIREFRTEPTVEYATVTAVIPSSEYPINVSNPDRDEAKPLTWYIHTQGFFFVDDGYKAKDRYNFRYGLFFQDTGKPVESRFEPIQWINLKDEAAVKAAYQQRIAEFEAQNFKEKQRAIEKDEARIQKLIDRLNILKSDDTLNFTKK